MRKHVVAPVDEFLEVDKKFRETKHALGTANAESNRVAKSIGALIGQGKKEEAERARGRAGTLRKNRQP